MRVFQVQEKGMSGKEKGGDKSAGKKRTLSSKAKSEKSDKSEKVEKSEKEKESEVGAADDSLICSVPVSASVSSTLCRCISLIECLSPQVI